MELFKLLGTVAVETSEANKNIDETTTKVEESEGKMSKAFKAIGAAVVAAFAVDKIMDFGGAVVGMADDAQKAMNQFAASTGADMAEYEDVLKSIYKNNYGESFEDIAASMSTVKQQMGDIDAGTLEGLTTEAIILRDTFGFEVNESIRAAKMLMDQFNISGTEAFNMIAQGAQQGLDKNGDLLDSINEYAVHYEQLGFTAEGFFASLQNGTKAGTFSVDKLGDAMKEFGIRATDGSDSSRQALEMLGYDADAMFQIFNEGGAGASAATQDLINRIAAMPEGVDQTTAGVALFGTMFEDLGVKGIKALGNVNGSISTTKKTLEQINKVKYKSFSEGMEGVKRTFETAILMPMGEMILPMLTETLPEKLEAITTYAPIILEGFETAITGIQTAFSRAKEFIQPILETGMMWIQENVVPVFDLVRQGISNAITPIGEIIGGLIAIAQTNFLLLSTILSEVFGGLATNVQSTFTILSTILGEIFSVASVIVTNCLQVLSDKTQTVFAIISEVISIFSGVSQTIFAAVSDALSNLGGAFESVGEIVTYLYDSCLSLLIAGFETVVNLLKEIVVPIILLVADVFMSLAEEVMRTVEIILPHLQNIADKAMELGRFVKEAVEEYVLPVLKAFIDMAKELWEENKDKLSLIGDLFESIFSFISNVVSGFVEGCKKIFIPFLEWVKEFVTDNLDKIKGIFQSAIDVITGIIQVFTALFKGDWEGMWEAIKETLNAAWDTIKGVFSLAWEAIKKIWEDAGIGDFFAGIWEGIKNAFGAVSTWFKDVFADAWQGVKDIFCKGGEIFDGITEGIGDFFKTTVNGIIGGINKVIAVPFKAINGILKDIRNIEIVNMKPFDWVTTFTVPEIPLLEKGGVLEKGQVGLLEGNGAEAVVPLDQNDKWISRVAQDMNAVTGNDALLQKILDVLLEIRDRTPEEFADIVASMKFELNNREFARLVKAVN